VVFLVREMLPAKLGKEFLGFFFLSESNPSRKIAGRNFGGCFVCERNPSRKIAGKILGGCFVCKRIPSRKFAGRNVAEQEFRIMNVG
jgi:hypothetical protein